jgi:hypothetical protein
MEVIWVTEAVYRDEFQIFLKFNDGTSGLVDLKNKLNGPIFEPLAEIEYFKNFCLNTWTIEWPNGADLAPEFLYHLVTEKQTVSEGR